MVVNPAVFEADPDSLATQPAGSGPFVLDSYVQNSKAVLHKNDKYFEADEHHDHELRALPGGRRGHRRRVAAVRPVQRRPAPRQPGRGGQGRRPRGPGDALALRRDARREQRRRSRSTTPRSSRRCTSPSTARRSSTPASSASARSTTSRSPTGYVGYNPELDDIYAYDPDKAKQLLEGGGLHRAGPADDLDAATPRASPSCSRRSSSKVGFEPTIETIPQAQFTQQVYINHEKALAVDGFAGRESPAQAFQVLFSDTGLMNPGREYDPERQGGASRRSSPRRSTTRRTPTCCRRPPRSRSTTMPNTFLYSRPRVVARAKAVSELPEHLTLVDAGKASRSRECRHLGHGSAGRRPSGRRAARPAGCRCRRGRSAGCSSSRSTVFVLSTILTFALGALSGANPAAAVLGETATPADIARMKHEFGLDGPLWQQYVTWLGNALQGDLGRSWFTTVPVADSIRTALPVDLSIAGLALVMAVADGRRRRHRGGAEQRGRRRPRGDPRLLGRSRTVPPFVIGMTLIVVFSVKLGLLPSGGYVPLDAGPGRVAAVRDPAGAGAQHRRRRLPRPPAADLAGRRAARELRHRRRDARVLAPPGAVRARAAQRLGADAGRARAWPCRRSSAARSSPRSSSTCRASPSSRCSRRGAGRRPGHPRHPAGHRRRRADREHGRQRRADRPQPGRPSRAASREAAR